MTCILFKGIKTWTFSFLHIVFTTFATWRFKYHLFANIALQSSWCLNMKIWQIFKLFSIAKLTTINSTYDTIRPISMVHFVRRTLLKQKMMTTNSMNYNLHATNETIEHVLGGVIFLPWDKGKVWIWKILGGYSYYVPHVFPKAFPCVIYGVP